jgi:hypothetical protein
MKGNKTALTHREKFVLALSVFVLGLSFLFPSAFVPENEMAFLVFFVLPLGILLVTDPERRRVTS